MSDELKPIRLVIGKFLGNPESPRHALYSPFTDTIYVPTDDPDVPAHIALSHEIAHHKLGHFGPTPESEIGHEFQATELEIRQLMSGGEYTPEAKKAIIFSFSSYVGKDMAEKLVSSMEKRARRELRKKEA